MSLLLHSLLRRWRSSLARILASFSSSSSGASLATALSLNSMVWSNLTDRLTGCIRPASCIEALLSRDSDDGGILNQGIKYVYAVRMGVPIDLLAFSGWLRQRKLTIARTDDLA